MNELTINTSLIEVKVLKVGNNRMTQSVVRQINEIAEFGWLKSCFEPEEISKSKPLFLDSSMIKIFGYVNYCPDLDFKLERYDVSVANLGSKATIGDVVNLIYINDGQIVRAYIPKKWVHKMNIDHLFISI